MRPCRARRLRFSSRGRAKGAHAINLKRYVYPGGEKDVVLFRVYRGLKKHLPFRWTEWAMLWPAFGMWVVLQWDPIMFSRSASFIYLARYANEGTWATILGFLGVLRLFALTINGAFDGFAFSPHI